MDSPENLSSYGGKVRLSILASHTFATPQVLDVLRFEERNRSIWYITPLDAKITPDIKEKWFNRTCTACLSGYVAFWEIDDHYLVLRDIKACGPNLWDFTSVPLSAISPEWTNKVRATWFSGRFMTPIWQSRRWTGLPIYIAREFCIEDGRLTSTSLFFPILDPIRPFLFTVPLMVVVIVLGLGLLRSMRRIRPARTDPPG